MEWPGNVRELRKVVRRMVLFAGDQDTINEKVFQETISSRSDQQDDQDRSKANSFSEPLLQDNEDDKPLPSLDQLEEQAIRKTLNHTEGDTKKAANLLGIARSTLYNKINEYNIDLNS